MNWLLDGVMVPSELPHDEKTDKFFNIAMWETFSLMFLVMERNGNTGKELPFQMLVVCYGAGSKAKCLAV
jgi:hypothetical protein